MIDFVSLGQKESIRKLSFWLKGVISTFWFCSRGNWWNFLESISDVYALDGLFSCVVDTFLMTDRVGNIFFSTWTAGMQFYFPIFTLLGGYWKCKGGGIGWLWATWILGCGHPGDRYTTLALLITTLPFRIGPLARWIWGEVKSRLKLGEIWIVRIVNFFLFI